MLKLMQFKRVPKIYLWIVIPIFLVLGSFIYREIRLTMITDNDVSSSERCFYKANQGICLEKDYCKWSNKYNLCCFKSERFQDRGKLGRPLCCPKGAICD